MKTIIARTVIVGVNEWMNEFEQLKHVISYFVIKQANTQIRIMYTWAKNTI